MPHIEYSYDTDSTTTTVTTVPEDKIVTTDVYYGSANLARLIQSINKSLWADDLLRIYNSSLRYDENNTQILVFGQMQVEVALPEKSDTKHIERLSELVHDRYPLVASSFMSWGVEYI